LRAEAGTLTHLFSGDEIFVWLPELKKKKSLIPNYKHGDGMKLTGYILQI
jgi:hypothetical protein